MNDVLAELSMLSQVLQRSSLTIRQAQCQIQLAVERLQRRKEKADELYPLTADTFRSVPLTDRKAHKSTVDPKSSVSTSHYRSAPAAADCS